MIGRFWQPYMGQAVGREFDLMVLIGGAEERPAIPESIFIHCIPAAKT
jgi:hypothetical protein